MIKGACSWTYDNSFILNYVSTIKFQFEILSRLSKLVNRVICLKLYQNTNVIVIH